MASNKSKGDFSFSVLENGLDFIATALDHIGGDPDARDIKYSILHLSAGLELLLKDRLHREHWALVFSDLNTATRDSYEDGDFRSVGLNECVIRLSSICNVEVSEAHKKAINSLKKRRNRLEHFATTDSSMAMKASAAKVTSFVLDFISEQHDESLFSSTEKGMLNSIRQALPSFEKLVQDRMKQIQTQLDKLDSVIVECPRCTIESASLDGGLSCLFCGYAAEGDAAASEYVRSLFGLDWRYEANGGRIPIYQCPECWVESLVDIGHLKQDLREDRMACFSCGSSWAWDEIDFCLKCGNPFPSSDDGMTVCSDCFN
jgi:transcription elongation factor Elf1